MEPDEPAWTQESRQDAQLRATRFHILQSQSLPTFLYPVISAAVLAVMVWSLAPRGALLAWLALVLALTAVRFAMLARVRGRPATAPAGEWLNLFAVSAGLSGLLWGAAPMLLVSRQPDRLVEDTLHGGLVMMVVCGLVAGATVAYAATLRVLFAFTVPALVPPGFYFISLGDRFSGGLGGFVLLYLVFISVAGLRMHWQLRHYFELEYQLDRLRRDLAGDGAAPPGSAVAVSEHGDGIYR